VSDVVWSVACGKVAVTVGLNSDSGMPEMCPRADVDCLQCSSEVQSLSLRISHNQGCSTRCLVDKEAAVRM
jgi:hypothetical protein